jgi:hypothetical protein
MKQKGKHRQFELGKQRKGSDRATEVSPLTVFQRASWGTVAGWLRLHVPTNHENVSRSDIATLRQHLYQSFFEVSTLMVNFSQKLEHPRFVQKKFSRKRDTVQGEKAWNIPQLLQARAEEAEVALTAKNRREVTCVHGPP